MVSKSRSRGRSPSCLKLSTRTRGRRDGKEIEFCSEFNSTTAFPGSTATSRPNWAAVAAVVAADGTTVDEDALAAHCRATLAGYKVPKRFVGVDSLQRSPAGKADYKLLRTVAEEALS